MKKLTLAISCGLLLGSVAAEAKEYRTFTSADGTKTIRATVANVTTAKDGSRVAVIQKENGKRYKFPASALSADDQKYIDKVASIISAARNIKVEVKDTIERGNVKKGNQRKISTDKVAFDISLRNDGKEALENVVVKYKIFYTKEDRLTKKSGKRERTKNVRHLKTQAGEFTVSNLLARADYQQSTDTVALVSDRANPG
jgi:hypothetical protein